jgi:hypothetical protein
MVDLSAVEALVKSLSPERKAELQKLVSPMLNRAFIPVPGPQTDALNSKADILLYGGAAGGGKSALEVGAFFCGHHDGVVFRREAVQLDGLTAFVRQIGEPAHGRFVGGNENVFKRNDGGRLKFAGLNMTDDWRKHAGNPRDLMCFDEAGEFTRDQVFSLIGWNRSVRDGQRCRVILGSNPPRGGDGLWLIEEFAPWLDPLHPDPASPGELKWAIVVGGVTEWVDGPGTHVRNGEPYEALSRTFIPAKLDDNPYLKETGYRARVMALPEPLRSQLLHGDFLAGREDHENQLIPTEWVTLAQERWRKAGDRKRRMLAISCDVALGGKDDLVIGSMHEDWWFSPLHAIKGVSISSPVQIAHEIAMRRRDNADVSVDMTGGWGSGVKSHLEQDQGIFCTGIVYSAKSGAFAYNGAFQMENIRSEMWVSFKEALDPQGPVSEPIMLPDDPRLLAELTAPRWSVKRGNSILIESKDDIRARLGTSTDRADVVVMLWHRRREAAVQAMSRNSDGSHKEYMVAGSDDWL